jgi:DNA-binding transcriptional regulator YiaG
MDAGLQVKELAALVGVTADTVINWEIRGMKPRGRYTRERIIRLFKVPVAFE